MFKYFELVFSQLQLVKISCKLLIIWVSYDKKGVLFYETSCIIRQITQIKHRRSMAKSNPSDKLYTNQENTLAGKTHHNWNCRDYQQSQLSIQLRWLQQQYGFLCNQHLQWPIYSHECLLPHHCTRPLTSDDISTRKCMFVTKYLYLSLQ